MSLLFKNGGKRVLKPSFEELRQICPDVPDGLLRAHLERLGENYYGIFTPAQAGRHLRALAGLNSENPVHVLFENESDGKTVCTVLACDYPSEFSLISGVLAGMGGNILAGNVFTYRPLLPEERDNPQSAVIRRMIIDRFVIAVQSDLPAAVWREKISAVLGEVIRNLEMGGGGLENARRMVNEMVAARLAVLKLQAGTVLYPVAIEVTDTPEYTRLTVISQDTPAFLYTLSAALALQNLSIEQVKISTAAGKIQDEIDILDKHGLKISDAARLDTVKIAILLTKQFTCFLGISPDPYAALCRFDNMLKSVLAVPNREEWIKLLSTPQALQNLARLLGASDYVWEDFVRLQYETLLPILNAGADPKIKNKTFATPPEGLEGKLARKLKKAEGMDEERRILNEFKNDELYLIDLEQILNPAIDVKMFSRRLTRLAEAVVRAAAEIIFRNLREKHGLPRTIAGFEVQWAIFGLGKFGGEALGYASDIELLLVFGDNGKTDGARGVANSDYFCAAAGMLSDVIAAKREGIFRVDTRLRPYGESGPRACSLESFCRYYGSNGKAHSYERLALVRLRAVAGDAEMGARVARLRDEFVYGASNIKFDELRALREKQLAEKISGGRCNAKFSPGALVDLEYDIQLLQVMHGRHDARLRTPRIHEALEELSALGVLGREESRQLTEAYYFFRRLINGLRMLRGSARDLFLPPVGSPEFVHLARRMGYQRDGRLEPEQSLRVEFETRTAAVRAFVERHFGRDSLPGKPQGNMADLVLSDLVPAPLRERILAPVGFKNAERAYLNLRKLRSGETDGGGGGQEFAVLAVLAGDHLRRSVDPDRALNNWERYARAAGGGGNHFKLLLAQPKRLEILLNIFAASQFLADTLVANPEFLNWVTAAEVINGARPRGALESDLRDFSGGRNLRDWLNAVRRFRSREILRIGTRDICLHAPISGITADLSSLAEVMIRAAMERFGLETGLNLSADFCVVAFGKLGGRELNYSSDIDLLGIFNAAEPAAGDMFCRAMRQVGKYLSGHTEEGHAYRVDFRLRPYGRAGQVACSLPALADYYCKRSAPWEIQALLKARPVAGSEELGGRFVEMARRVIRERKDNKEIIASIEKTRRAAVGEARNNGLLARDIKNGQGGIRDIEFLAQGLQLVHASAIPELINGNTLDALTVLGRRGLIPPEAAEQLKRDYEFLRRVEHCLQIFEDRQVHVLPGPGPELEGLARRVMGYTASPGELLNELAVCRARAENYLKTHLTLRAAG
ncbi:MAG: glutamate-ammonia-ligase adenylyltransferase [Kiritimatiellae bacterium]|nr:glutamate-ammonia-ligase adenylyltransferase [Kiritimatiellia bacterium]